MRSSIKLKLKQSKYLCLAASIIFFSVLLQLGCLKEKVSKECEQFYDLSSNQREEIIETYDLDKQLRIHRCGLDLVPKKIAYAIPIAKRGKTVIPTLLNKLSTEADEKMQYAIILVFHMMSAEDLKGNEEVVIRSIENAIAEMQNKAVKEDSQRSLVSIKEDIQK